MSFYRIQSDQEVFNPIRKQDPFPAENQLIVADDVMQELIRNIYPPEHTFRVSKV